MAVVHFLTALLVCQAHSQMYGPGPIFPGCGLGCDPLPIGPAPCGPPFINLPNQIPPCPIINQPQPIIAEVPSVLTNPCTPVVTTTILDNSLANSLANAIQLLIVSNLIENTLGSSNGASIAQSLGIIPDVPSVNNFELVTDYYPNPIVPLPIYDCPTYDPFPTYEVPCYQEPIFQPCTDSCGLAFPQYQSVPVINELPFAFDNCAQNIIFDTCNQCGVPYGCADMVIAPVAVEVPFPASIPAQLLCNFGYTPNNVPCVSVNVEPLPLPYLDTCNNPFGNIFF